MVWKFKKILETLFKKILLATYVRKYWKLGKILVSIALWQLFMSRSIFEYSRQSLSVERENPVQMVSNCLQQSHLDKIASKPSKGEFRREMKNSSETCKAFPNINSVFCNQAPILQATMSVLVVGEGNMQK